MADRALDAALTELSARPDQGKLEELAAGRMLTAVHTIDVWLQHAARAMDAASPAALAAASPPASPETPSELPAVALHARAAIADAARALLDEAARACGSHPFATGGDLDRARRDLELFLLQHRLDPGLTAAGARALDEHRGKSG
jgi:hypothetical protein